MVEKSLETSETPHVTVETCLGNLTVRGEGEREIRLLVHEHMDEVRLDRQGETLTVTFPEDGTLVCPPKTTLTIEQVQGNLMVDGVHGTLAIGAIHGNGTLSDVGHVAFEEALGNLKVRAVAGDLHGEVVRGNARVHGVNGRLRLGEVAGNLVTAEIGGDMDVTKVRGNARLGPGFVAGSTYRVNASGNVTVMVEPGAAVRMTFRADGRVRSHVDGLVLETFNGQTSGVLGAGEAAVDAEVRGNVTVRSFDAEERHGMSAALEELGVQIEWQVNQAMAELATQLERNLSRVDGEAVRQRVDAATEQARRKAEQAAERARIRAERAERRWRRATGERPPAEQQAPTDEETLRILRMVETGKITPGQAADLLGAIEGK